MKISLCTIAYNEEKNLPALLADIEHQDYPHSELEIILVDSMSAVSYTHLTLPTNREV